MEEITRAEAFVRMVGPWLVHIVEACSVLVILYGVARTFAGFIANVIRIPTAPAPTRIRLNLGQSLSLALEFLLAADILQTMVAPSLEQLVALGIVAAIRTALNYFLARELAEERKELEGAAVASESPETAPSQARAANEPIEPATRN
jgi:uncharacterized membrane protein